MPGRYKFVIAPEQKGLRLDVALAQFFPEYSRSYLQELMEEGRVLYRGAPLKAHTKVVPGETLLVEIPEPVPLELQPEKMDLEILFEDVDLLVLNKPPGLVVHPAPGNLEHTLVHGLLYHCRNLSSINGVLRPGIVHRLDKDTSGCLVVAKNNLAHQKLAEQFESRAVEKTYLCLVEGKWAGGSRRLEGAIGRHPVARKKMAVRRTGGKEALTLVKPVEVFDSFSLLEITIKTGRTHQIRVHMAHAGHPVVGDPEYGRGRKIGRLPFPVDRQMLHAQRLGFTHPRTGEKMRFTAPLPEDMKSILHHLEEEK